MNALSNRQSESMLIHIVSNALLPLIYLYQACNHFDEVSYSIIPMMLVYVWVNFIVAV